MIKDLKELEKLLKLCRKQGVTEVNLSGVIIKFGDMPRKSTGDVQDSDDPETDELTPEQLMFFSSPREVEGMGG